jgi:3'(2'), 5'-bisphosphate nucleotidase
MSPLFQYERDVALAAVREAARLTQAVQAELNPDVIEKRDRSPVTVADFGSQALVCRTIKEAFPEDPIIAEEDASALRQADNAIQREQVVQRVQALRPDATTEEVLSWIDCGNARNYSERYWTLDPIDGTKGFLRNEQYAIALALVVDGQVAVAAMACPNLPDPDDSTAPPGGIYTAIRGGGTVHVALAQASTPTPVQVSTRQLPTEALYCESVESGHSSHQGAAAMAHRLGLTADPVRMDSQAKYALVAHGMADIYTRLPTPKRPGYIENIWDHAAGALVVIEAGGRVTDITGQPLNFSFGQKLERNRGIVATNGLLHDDVLAALKAVEFC